MHFNSLNKTKFKCINMCEVWQSHDLQNLQWNIVQKK